MKKVVMIYALLCCTLSGFAEEEDAILKSSVIVRKGGIFHIYQEIKY